jgi:hypothetical protein
VDDSGSEGDVSETECSPFDSDSDAGIRSHCTGMNFKTVILIIARFHYFSSNNVTGMLYFAEQLIITIFVQKITLHPLGWSHHKHPAQLSTSRSPATGQSSKRKRNSRNGTSDSALGWSFLDQQPSFLSKVDQLQQRLTTPHHLIFFFSIFFPEFMMEHIKTETNRYVKSIAGERRRTNKLKPHSIWQTWTGVMMHEMYLFFAVIIHMCLVKKPKFRDYWSTSNFISIQFSGSVI